ncbi:MAG: hypothetical protein ACR2O2_16650 [Ruegeria sp.]
MKPTFRRYLAYVLSLLVILTGQGVAASRGINEAVGQMVLCTGSGPVVVYMDETGQPTKPPHYCPDFAVNLLGVVFVEQPTLPPAPDRVFPALPLGAENLVALPLPQTPARAPPVSV